MKNIYLFLIAFLFFGLALSAQSVLPLRADTVRIYKQGGNAELRIENSTRAVKGLAVNLDGKGTVGYFRTVKLNDTAYIIAPGDTLIIHGVNLANYLDKTSSDTLDWHTIGYYDGRYINRVTDTTGLGWHTTGFYDGRYINRVTDTTGLGWHTTGFYDGRYINKVTDTAGLGWHTTGFYDGRYLSDTSKYHSFNFYNTKYLGVGYVQPLTATDIGYGDGSGNLTGTSSFQWNDASHLLKLNAVSVNYFTGPAGALFMVPGGNIPASGQAGTTVFGWNAYHSTATGLSNTGFGSDVFNTVTTGSQLTFFGASAGQFATTQTRGIGIGYLANINGDDAIKIGSSILLGRINAGNRSILIGDDSTLSYITVTNAISIGHGLATIRNNVANFGTTTQLISLGNGGGNTTAMNALTGMAIGDLFNNTDSLGMCQWNGTAWERLGRRGYLVLNRRGIADIAATISVTDYLIAYTSITAARAVTLPAASACTNMHFLIVDESGSATSSNKITIVGTVNGASNPDAVTSAYGHYKFYSNGSAFLTE